jgi:predicted PurR-regulated permease PerM
MAERPSERSPSEAATRFRYGLQVATLAMLLMVLVTIALKELSAILQPLFIGVFISYLIMPAHHWLTRHRIPSALSYVLIALVVLSVLGGVGAMLVKSVGALITKVPLYEKRLDLLVVKLNDVLPWRIPGMQFERVRDIPLLEFVSAEKIADTLRALAGTLAGWGTKIVVILFYLIFLVAEGATFRTRVENAFGDRQTRRIMGVVSTINKAISQYIAVKTLVSFMVASLSTIILGSFGVDFWILWGILTFLANFIPYVGSMAAVVPPIVLSFIQFDEPWKGAIIGGLLIGAQLLTGNYLEPRIAGQKLGVSPIMILLSLAFWGWLWGVTGMILAVPIVVIIKIVLDNIQQTKPIATLLSNI